MAAPGQGRGTLPGARRPHGLARGARCRRGGGRGVSRDMSLLRGSAFVTGGGSGIGRAIAEALAAQGAPVAVLDLLPDGGKETVGAIEARGGRARFLQGDASRWSDVDAAVAATVATLGPLGIMVNAAGILDGYAPADELTLAVWDRVVSINLTGTFLGCKRALAEMLPRSAGRIVNIASVAGVVGSGGGPAYVASKHGVVGLTRQLAVSYAARGVTVNAICPGAVATSLRANSTRILGKDAPEMRGIGGDDAAVRAITPAGRRGTLEEVAAAACYLAGEEAAYVTGQTLVIDGGWTAR
ncbi:MAG: NAD(P)-dependent oxidoreductase [Candidatus Rokuibacteriota bacterium]|nr:MAG: NAD(P)-dependent oxidoreductase [Candidatus Rokubacteria bacterium]